MVYTLSHFQLEFKILAVSVNIYHNPFSFFFLDKSISILFWIGETSVVWVLPLSLQLLCPRVQPCEVWLYSRGHPFSLLVDSALQQMDQALVNGCLAVFPRLKGRQKCLFFLCDFWMALIVDRNIVRITTIPELWDWSCFLSPFWPFLLSFGLGFIKYLIGKTTTDFVRHRFCTHNFVCGLTIKFKKYFI